MRSLIIKIKGMLSTSTHEVDVPESYRELSSDQFHAICRLNRAQGSSEDFICEFFGISHYVFTRLDSFYVYMLTELIRGMKGNASCSSFYDSTVRFGKNKRQLPNMPSMSMMQFMAADTYAQWYQHTKKVRYLISFVATVALPPGVNFFDYDPKEFTESLQDLASQNHDILEQMEDLFLNWQFIKTHLADSYPNMFPQSEGNSEEQTRPGDWSNLFDSLVGERLEHLEAYKRLPAYDVFRIIDTRIRESKFRK